MKCFQSSLNFTEHVLLGKHLTWKCPKKREFYENCLLIPLLEPNTSQHASIELAGQTKHVSIFSTIIAIKQNYTQKCNYDIYACNGDYLVLQ